MSRFEVLDLSQADQWNYYLRQLPVEQQDIYYTPAYYKLYEDYGDGKAQCFVFKKDGDIALYPFLLNSVNNKGYDLDSEYYDIQGAYGYNGVISSCYSAEFIGSFYKSFYSFINNNNIIAEFTRFHPIIKNHEFSINNLNIIVDRKTVYVDLRNDYEFIYKNFQHKTQRQIRKAINRFNIEVVRIEKDISQINSFCEIYYETMKRVNADRYYYFDNDYFENLINNNSTIQLVAKFENNPIASILIIYSDKYIHGHLGGARTEYLNLSSYSLLYSEMIKIGIEKKCSFLHLGGGSSNRIDDSLFIFKTNFSNTILDFYIGKKIHNPKIYDAVIEQWIKKEHTKSHLYNHLILKYRY